MKLLRKAARLFFHILVWPRFMFNLFFIFLRLKQGICFSAWRAVRTSITILRV